MEVLQDIFLVIQIVLAILIVVLVLLQSSSGGDGLVSTYNVGGMVTARAAANLLSRATMILAAFFMANTLALGVIAKKKSVANSIVEELLEKDRELQIPLAQ